MLLSENIADCSQHCGNGDAGFPFAASLYLLSFKYALIIGKTWSEHWGKSLCRKQLVLVPSMVNITILGYFSALITCKGQRLSQVLIYWRVSLFLNLKFINKSHGLAGCNLALKKIGKNDNAFCCLWIPMGSLSRENTVFDLTWSTVRSE